ncbi:GNAT family N-acetyltransferase [Planococcus salinus]|uniref:N-acetyltransferase n=1 Tax=Planococcus salinus TaxID=1848460 RepID=A0A3M8P7F5_9BACL|nr:GNAT family N-acetyltransferase [Planococcus salinus]RNF39124.1 N-acetyltransferase [Planococcus salinus]
MEFTHENNQITATENSEELGFITYVPNGNVLTVAHTEVSPQAEGRGLGKKLVQQIVQYARDEDKTIVAQCAFASSVIEKTPEFQDVLEK